MDFYGFRTKENKNGTTELYPSFRVGRSKDLMVRGGQFYAVWDAEAGLWSTDEYDVARIVDQELFDEAKSPKHQGRMMVVKDMSSADTNTWYSFKRFVSQVGDNHHQLDQSLTFANTVVKKEDYVSKRLPYSIKEGDCSAWDELVGTLYSVEEREKIEWAIGAIVSGDSKKIQKFLVLYGPAGTGKSTILNIVEMLFAGYTTTFEAKALGSNNNQFATEVFKTNPLVAIQHDGDLSRIEDNTKLNSIVSHEEMTMNEKYKSSYTARVNAFLFMGTNQPVRISDAKSGIIRRLIDVHPTGVYIPNNHYNTLMSRVEFELGAIAAHCLDVYRRLGKNYYNAYRPVEMMFQTDVFFNFIESSYDVFKEQDGCTLAQSYQMYKEYCSDSGVDKPLPRHKFREELRNYFDDFKIRSEVDGVPVRSYYSGFNAAKFKTPKKDSPAYSLVLDEKESLFDYEFANLPAQYATSRETPKKKWAEVETKLGELDTSQLHFVLVPENHIVIDFDLKDPKTGEKSLDRNLEAASIWPQTYAELSKSALGVHLHYDYEGDVSQLSSIYSEGIEIKTLTGDASLRRRLSKCNNVPIATISGGLPLKEKPVHDVKTLKSEKGVRDMIERCLKKEFHAGTKSNVSFIKQILDDAYAAGISYDVTDLRNRIIVFANASTNQPIESIRLVKQMKFSSGDRDAFVGDSFPEDGSKISAGSKSDKRLVFFDIEVYPNLFVICWKYDGAKEVIKMVNPSPEQIETLLGHRLVGFNNRRYDNHLIYAAWQGYSNKRLYDLSYKIINDKTNSSTFGAAYNISYADIYDFSSKKQGLKKFGIELGMNHMEMDIPWDQPVPDDMVDKVVEYCVNDVELTEATFHARKQDFVAREILAELSGLTVNDTTQKHTAKIIFGNDRYPQRSFVYTHLKEMFPGYLYDAGKSTYQGELVGEGGYVYAEPGMYENVVVLDVASMHPTSIIELNLFGNYTPNFKDLLDARIAIKRGNFNEARKMLDGRLAPYLADETAAKELSYALKIVINIVYGLTSAKFDNPFRDVRNKDNIVAKRGALFMIDLKNYAQAQGYTVVHIKTDSIKIALKPGESESSVVADIMKYGANYGYEFEHEDTYKKFCLVNDAVYIAKKENDKWEAVGAQFQHPVVFKTLFSGEQLFFEDYCEAKSVQKGAMYLDYNHDKPQPVVDDMRFVGRTGLFVPVNENEVGAKLYRVDQDKLYAVTGTKDYLWSEADVAAMNESILDRKYYDKLLEAAMKAIGKYGDFDEFVS